LEALAADRRAEGDSVLLLDAALDGHDDVRLARRAAAFGSDAIGFSLATAQDLHSALTIHSEASLIIARSRQRVHWVAGGNFVTSEPEHADRLLPQDWRLVRGEGELGLASLVREWSEGRDGPRVQVGRAVACLDDLPIAERPYARQILANGWSFNLQGSRGCSGACHYCASPGLVLTHGRRWRGRSCSLLVEEVAQLQSRYGARCFNVVDEDFLGPRVGARQRALDLATAISRRQLHVSFGIQVRPASLDPEIIDALADAGVHYVFFGMESDSAADLRAWGRPSVPAAWEYVDYLRARGVDVNVGALLFHRRSALSSVRRFAQALQARDLLDYRTATNRMDAIPGSALYADERHAGRLNPQQPGPQTVPFADPTMGNAYADICQSLAPLGPPSMHAVCALPALSARERTEGYAGPDLKALRSVIASAQAAVAEVFFAVLEIHETKVEDKVRNARVLELRAHSFERALGLVNTLVQVGLATSFDQLREAIRIDAGL